MKAMFGVGGHEDDAASFNWSIFGTYLDGATATDDIVNLIFGVGLLSVDSTDGEHIKADAKGGLADKFEVAVISLVTGSDELGEFEGIHEIVSPYVFVYPLTTRASKSAII